MWKGRGNCPGGTDRRKYVRGNVRIAYHSFAKGPFTATQLNVELSWVELCRYKRALTFTLSTLCICMVYHLKLNVEGFDVVSSSSKKSLYTAPQVQSHYCAAISAVPKQTKMSSVIDGIRQAQCPAVAVPAASCSRSGGRQRENSGRQNGYGSSGRCTCQRRPNADGGETYVSHTIRRVLYSSHDWRQNVNYTIYFPTTRRKDRTLAISAEVGP